MLDQQVEVTPLEDGGAEVAFGAPPALSPDQAPEHEANLVDFLDEDTLEAAAKVIIDEFESDMRSRSDWEQVFEHGVRLLGLKVEEGSEPFEGACSATHPLLIENVVKFQAKASTELFPAGGPVKTQIIGVVDEAREQQAIRVKEFMNWQLTEQMPEYFDELERLLFYVALFGSGFKKLFYHAGYGRMTCEFVSCDDFYVSNFAQNLRTADRYTHRFYRTETQLEQDISGKLYADIDIGDPQRPIQSTLQTAMSFLQGIQPSLTDKDRVYEILEQHRYLSLPGDDPKAPPAPYVVTVEKNSRKVLAIRRLWRKDDPLKRKIIHFTHYRYVPGFGFYGLGLIHFLGNLTLASTSSMRALIDAASFANMQGGIKLKGMRFTDEAGAVSPGEFKDVEYDGDDIKKGIMVFPFKEPSLALLQMYKETVGAGQKFADTTEQVISESTNYGPVGTTLALLEASTKFFSAIHKRLHKAQKEEFKLLAELNYDWLDGTYPYDVVGGERTIMKQDFDGRIDVLPVSDPNTPSAAHRLAKANLALELSQKAPPGTFNNGAIYRYVLTAADVPNVQSMVVDPEASVEPRDPMSDIKAALQGLPVRAYPGQDHDAYVAIFASFVQDPNIGMNPTFGPTINILTAAIRDHQVAKWMMQVEAVMKQGARPGVIPEQLMAQAAQEVKSANEMRAKMGPDGQINPELLLAQSAMMDAQTKKLKITADQISDAAQYSTENRRLDIERFRAMNEAYDKRANLQEKVSNKITDSNTKLATKAAELLVKDAVSRRDAAVKIRTKSNAK